MHYTPKVPDHPAAKRLLASGWTIAGGLWGTGAWMLLPDGRVLGLSDENNAVPTDEDGLVVTLWLYSPPFYEGWSVTEGESPIEIMDYGPQGNCLMWTVDNLPDALAIADELQRGVSVSRPADR